MPELTAMFWVIKLLSTAMGESTSDYLVFHIDPYVAVVLACIGLRSSWSSSSAARYVAWIYWLTIVMVAVFGTMVADVMHVVLGIPYVVSTVALARPGRHLRGLVPERTDPVHPQHRHAAA